jgi:hypothetical protein
MRRTGVAGEASLAQPCFPSRPAFDPAAGRSTASTHFGTNRNRPSIFVTYQVPTGASPLVLASQRLVGKHAGGPLIEPEVPMKAQRLSEAGRRKGDRHEVDLPAVACRSDGTKIPVRVLNISYDGCQLSNISCD